MAQQLTALEWRELQLLRALDKLTPIWRPLLGPQTQAYESKADVIGFGGAAGGGKTDLAIGLALTKHRNSAVFRREGTELSGIIERLADVLGTRDGLSMQPFKLWRIPNSNARIEFGSIPNPGDERKYQGRPKDLLVLDEAANMLEAQARFLMGWVRTVDPNQQCRTLMCFNPPTNAEGRWIVKFFGPWLDDKHPVPALPGELRWFAMIDGDELEVVDGTPFTHNGELIRPQSRTFIPSRIADNPHLMGTNYMATLQALPEPLRSQMLYGDFKAGVLDDPWQVIPTAWVDAAMARWTELAVLPPMDSMGVDVARGGRDNTVIVRRHGTWFAKPLAYPGKETPDGPTTAALTVMHRRDEAVVHIDVVGVGSSPYDFLRGNGVQTVGVSGGEGNGEKNREGTLGFANVRSMIWWRMREALDPNANNGIALPPDPQLRADLCAPIWKPRTRGQQQVIEVEDRQSIIDRIGRSPDWGTACCLANLNTPKMREVRAAQGTRAAAQREHDPLANLR